MVVILYDQDLSLGLGTLAAVDAIAQAGKIDASRLNGFRIAMLRIVATVTGKTTAEGPLIWGIACNMDAAEIEAALEADPQSSADDDERGVGQWLKILGMIPLETTFGALTGGPGGPSAGSAVATPMDVKVNWSVLEGKEFVIWAYNQGAALTSGTIITCAIEYFGVWLRD